MFGTVIEVHQLKALFFPPNTRSADSSGSFGSRRRRRRPARNLRGRLGAAVVEFAIIAPLFFLLVMGMIEFGRMIMIQQLMTNAAREGARRAVIENATQSEVISIVQDYLERTSVPTAQATVSPENLALLGFGDPVEVQVKVRFADVSWLPAPWFLRETEIAGSCVMHAERLE